MELKEIVEKEREIIKNTSWYGILRGFVNSPKFEEIFIKLSEEYNAGIRFSPSLSKIFRPFEVCNYESLTKVILNTDVIKANTLLHNGLVFDCTGTYLENDVTSWFLKNTGENSIEEYSRKNNTLVLEESIVFLESEKKLFGDFLIYLFDMISSNKPDIEFINIGGNKTYGFKNYRLLPKLSKNWNEQL